MTTSEIMTPFVMAAPVPKAAPGPAKSLRLTCRMAGGENWRETVGSFVKGQGRLTDSVSVSVRMTQTAAPSPRRTAKHLETVASVWHYNPELLAQDFRVLFLTRQAPLLARAVL